MREDMIKNKYNKSSFKLILMDYEMPEINGPEACRQIREMLYFEEIDQPIVVAVIGHSDERFIQESIEAGMNTVF